MSVEQRVLLGLAHEALGDAGFAPRRLPARAGVFVCGGGLPHAIAGIDLDEWRSRRPVEYWELEVGHDKDYLASVLAYQLGVDGPTELVQTACSSALAASRSSSDSKRANTSSCCRSSLRTSASRSTLALASAASVRLRAATTLSACAPAHAGVSHVRSRHAGRRRRWSPRRRQKSCGCWRIEQQLVQQGSFWFQEGFLELKLHALIIF